MTRRLVANPPRTLPGIAETYGISFERVREISHELPDIDLVVLVVETAVSRRIALETALYLVRAEYCL